MSTTEKEISPSPFEAQLQELKQQKAPIFPGLAVGVILVVIWGVLCVQDQVFSMVYLAGLFANNWIESISGTPLSIGLAVEAVLALSGVVPFVLGLLINYSVFKLKNYLKILKVLNAGLSSEYPHIAQTALTNYASFIGVRFFYYWNQSHTEPSRPKVLEVLSRRNDLNKVSFSLQVNSSNNSMEELIGSSLGLALAAAYPMMVVAASTTSQYPLIKVTALLGLGLVYAIVFYRILASMRRELVGMAVKAEKLLTTMIQRREDRGGIVASNSPYNPTEINLRHPVIGEGTHTTAITKCFAWLFANNYGVGYVAYVLSIIAGSGALLLAASEYGDSRPFELAQTSIGQFESAVNTKKPRELWDQNKIALSASEGAAENRALIVKISRYEDSLTVKPSSTAVFQCKKVHQFEAIKMSDNAILCVHPQLSSDKKILSAIHKSYTRYTVDSLRLK